MGAGRALSKFDPRVLACLGFQRGLVLMPVTVTYDLANATTNQRTYFRSMLERFHWHRIGGSVFRYDGEPQVDGTREEDWLNHVVPALMFLRAYALNNGITLRFFTLDASSVAFVDHSDPDVLLGRQPQTGPDLPLTQPTNAQSSEQTIRNFVDAATNAT